MTKRIKILLSVLIVLCIFTVKNTYAMTLNCNDKKYMCYVCEYKTQKKNGNGPNFDVKVFSDGYGTLSANTSITTTFDGNNINTIFALPKNFQNGYSIVCPSTVNVCLSSMQYSTGVDEYIAQISGSTCSGNTNYTATLIGSANNGKPFFTKEQEEKVVGEDDEYKSTGYDVPIVMNNSNTGKTYHIDSKEQVINNQITSVIIDGTNYTVGSSNNTVTNVTPYSSIRLMCTDNWISKKCWFNDSEKQERREAATAQGADQDEYLDEMGDIFGNVDDQGSCDTLLDADAKELIITIFNWIRIITPILLVLLGALDFGKAVLASDEKQMAAATKNFITRCVIALAIFFVPLIIYYFMDIIMKSTGIVDDAGNICKFL